MIKLINAFIRKRYYYKSSTELVNVAKQFTTINNATYRKEDDTLTHVWNILTNDSFLYLNFVNEEEENEIMKDISKSFRRTKYEYDHWDGVSKSYKGGIEGCSFKIVGSVLSPIDVFL